MTVATYDVRTLAFRGKNGYGHDGRVLAKGRQLGCDFKDAEQNIFSGRSWTTWRKTISTKECLLVLIDANARTGYRIEGCGDDEIRVFVAYGRDVRNDNGKLLFLFATN